MKAKQLIEVLEAAGYEWRKYSGRGMSGKECVAVTIDDDDMFRLGAELTLAADGEHVPSPRTDQLGRQVIVYWPAARIEEAA